MTTGTQWERMWEVFHGALEAGGPERAAYVERACAGDEGLRSRVARLLESHGRAGEFMESAAAGLEGPPAEADGDGERGWDLPRTLGHYELRARLGEGGFSEVYLAMQTEPVRREVAVKVLRARLGAGGGLDSRRVLERFEAERQTLAVLQHPGIATIFDAGIDGGGDGASGDGSGGRPYFVMERIAGTPITRYCRERGLGLGERLDLVVQVCMAVQHAHQKGVIHRDLKPSNILVMEVDGLPRAKVIDFGIATAIDRAARLGEAGVRAVRGTTLVGTPGYMSPEQASAGDVDTRTDVFSLGVLMYELLAGAAPFESRGALFSELLERSRAGTNGDPPVPSEKAASAPEGPERCWARRLRGDLDAIVMRALARERADRYGSPAELAADIERHLSHAPVAARPATRRYRARKFIRRHRLGAGLALAGSLVALGGAAQLGLTARTEHRLRQAADREARISAGVNEFLTKDILAGADPRRAPNPGITMLEVVEAAEAKAGERFKDDPVVEAAVRHTLGDTYRSLGKLDQSMANLERSVALYTGSLGEDHQRTLAAIDDLAHVYQRLGRMTDAAPMKERSLAVRRRLYGPEDKGTIHALVNLGAVYGDMGAEKQAEGVRVLSEAIELMTRVLGPDDPDTVLAGLYLGIAYQKMNKHAESEPHLRAAWEKQTVLLGEDHPYTITARGSLALALTSLGRLEEAEPLHRATLEGSIRRLGEEHVETAQARVNLGVHYVRMRRVQDAEPLMLRGLGVMRIALGERHAQTMKVRVLIGEMYDHEGWGAGGGAGAGAGGRPADSEPYHREAADWARENLGEKEWARGLYLMYHGSALNRIGRHAEAEPRLTEGLAILAAVAGDENRHARAALRDLAEVCEALGRGEEASIYRARLAEAEKK
ncbi:MAG: serine/threonine-protein kinase [Phycisphaerales bacterium]